MFTTKIFAVVTIWLASSVTANIVFVPPGRPGAWIPVPIAIPGGNGGAGSVTPAPTAPPTQDPTQNPTPDPTQTPTDPPTQPPQACGDPDMGCVTGASAAMCGANNICDTSVESDLVQCYVDECIGSDPVPRCSCRNPDSAGPTPPTTTTTTTTQPPPVQQCGDPVDGCVTGTSGARCVNGVCDTSSGATAQCFVNDCLGRGPLPLCSCRNP